MNERANHMISKFNWDTTFDRKEKAHELQQRLSNWSQINMPGEITRVFDRVCPPEQTWKIQLMELDLGDIDFNNLEFELATNLRNKLKEKLIRLILYPNGSGHDIEIVNESSSPVYIISSFLLNGLMPWNYKPADGSYNAMLAYQLQNNRQQLIDMLREVGITHENVRKRMAHQTNEPNILKIIEGLEPNNHEQILNFSEEFVKIQVKETIIQTSTVDFKKNLWLWVLNYLFTERGTVFNKVAYMKSTIRQMAGHYNIAYNELLILIERAVTEVQKRADIRADFIFTLLTLLKEDRPSIHKTGNAVRGVKDYWLVLKDYFENHSLQKSGDQKNEFNELVIGLYRENAAKFSSLLHSFGTSNSLWLRTVADLNNASLECLFAALSNGKTAMLIESIYFIDKLSIQLSLNIDGKKTWETGLKFLLRTKNSVYNNQDFLSYCVAVLGKQSKLSKVQILDQLTSAKVPLSLKTITNLEIYNDLKAVFVAQLAKKDTTFLPNRFSELIDALSKLLITHAGDKELFVSLQNLLVKNIQLNPAAALRELMQYPDKDKIHQIIPYLLNNYTVHLLVNNVVNEKTVILSSVNRVLARLNKSKKSANVISLTDDNLMMAGLIIMIDHPNIGQSKYLEHLLNNIANQFIPSQSQQFSLFIGALLTDGKFRSLVGNVDAINQIAERFDIESKLSVLERVAFLIISSPYKKQEVCNLLITNFHDRTFINLRTGKNKESDTILDYLIPQGSQLMDALLREYVALLTYQLKYLPDSKAIYQLNELYWQCIINYHSHNCRADTLKKVFKSAVLFHFPVKNKIIWAAAPHIRLSNTKFYGLKSGDKIDQQQLFLLIENGLINSITTITHEGVNLYLNELISIGIELNPSAFRKIIATTAVSEKRIGLLISSISFSSFSLWIMNDGNRLLGKALEIMRSLYELVEQMASRSVADESLRYYWGQAWQLIKTNSWSAQNLNNLVQQSLRFIAQETDINSGLILSVLNENNIRLSPILERVLAKQLSSFSRHALSEVHRSPGYQLLKLERIGLLNEFIEQLIKCRQTPVWFGTVSEQDAKMLLNEVISFYPVQFLHVLKVHIITEPQMLWLSSSVSFKEFTHAAGVLNRGKQLLLHLLYEFYVALGNAPVSGVSTKDMQDILFRKVLIAWTTGNWRSISAENIWNELIWEVSIKRGVAQKAFIRDIKKAGFSFPAALQISLEYLSKSEIITQPNKTEVPKPAMPVSLKKEAEQLQKQTIFIRNAGLVLLNNYIPHLFKHLDLLANKKEFYDRTHQSNAVHYLQYVVSGLTQTEESLLPLNKILCGLHMSFPVKESIDISEKEKNIIDGLINAAISHWPRIGKCSINGFRGNWLVRNGLLTEQDDRWELTVEKRAYDLLIGKSPFSFSIIKYPWMLKPIYVTWPY